MNQFEKRIICL